MWVSVLAENPLIELQTLIFDQVNVIAQPLPSPVKAITLPSALCTLSGSFSLYTVCFPLHSQHRQFPEIKELKYCATLALPLPQPYWAR